MKNSRSHAAFGAEQLHRPWQTWPPVATDGVGPDGCELSMAIQDDAPSIPGPGSSSKNPPGSGVDPNSGRMMATRSVNFLAAELNWAVAEHEHPQTKIRIRDTFQGPGLDVACLGPHREGPPNPTRAESARADFQLGLRAHLLPISIGFHWFYFHPYRRATNGGSRIPR